MKSFTQLLTEEKLRNFGGKRDITYAVQMKGRGGILALFSNKKEAYDYKENFKIDLKFEKESVTLEVVPYRKPIDSFPA